MLTTACQRHVLRVRGILSMMVPLTLLCCAHATPNVLLIMTDDQGYGDLGVNGNPIIKTPHLDRLAGESVEVTQFPFGPIRLEASSAERLEVWIVEHGVERPYGVRYVNVRCLP